jgi:hypothetical protein
MSEELECPYCTGEIDRFYGPCDICRAQLRKSVHITRIVLAPWVGI